MVVTRDSVLGSLQVAERPLRTPALRAIARDAARELTREGADIESIFSLCDELVGADIHTKGAREAVFEICYLHRGLRDSLDWRKLERLGRTLDGWASVDHFARKLSGPAWQRGQITDARVMRWAKSTDFWRRRTGLVSTIALNERHLGRGDAVRTLMVCELFIDDRSDLHVKALSWALRELGLRDPEAVLMFIEGHKDRLHSRVIREVGNKLSTGHKLAKPSEEMKRRMRGTTLT